MIFSHSGKSVSEPMDKTITFLESLSTRIKQYILVFTDLLLIELSLWLSFQLQHNFEVVLTSSFIPLFILLPVFTIPVFMRIGMYKAVMRYVGQKALEQIFKGVFVSIIVLFALGQAFKPEYFSNSQLLIYGALFLSFTGSVRFIIRRLIDSSGPEKQGRLVAIYGAGSGGQQLLKMLRTGHEYKPVVFLDDSCRLQHREVDGVIVIDANIVSIEKELKSRKVEEIFLAIPSASRSRRREIIRLFEPLPYHVKSVPGIEDILNGKRIDQLQEIKIEDLLGRDQVPPDVELMDKCIKDKVVMVTGAGGSIGSELCRQIIPLKPKQLILVEQSEYLLYKVESEFRLIAERSKSDIQIIPLLVDICDEHHISHYLDMFSVDTIYHAAAYKHVPIVEHNIVAGIENNIVGTYNMAMLAMSANVETFVLISTDKAVRPTNVMGASKRFAELVLQGLAQLESSTNFCMVRFGNVLGSSGSVVPLFREQITNGGPVTITHEDMTRYFMTIPEASQLVIQAGAMSTGGDVFVLDMGEPVKIMKLATSMINLMGLEVKSEENPNGDIEIKVIGLRPGEKLFEELLIGENVSGTTHQKILRAEEDSLSYEEMNANIEVLKKTIQSYDILAIRKLLLAQVNGYKPIDNIVDHGYTQIQEQVLPLDAEMIQKSQVH